MAYRSAAPERVTVIALIPMQQVNRRDDVQQESYELAGEINQGVTFVVRPRRERPVAWLSLTRYRQKTEVSVWKTSIHTPLSAQRMNHWATSFSGHKTLLHRPSVRSPGHGSSTDHPMLIVTPQLVQNRRQQKEKFLFT
jgi:hypothetical protein